MPQLTWTIDADDSGVLQSLTGIAAAADRAAAAVKNVGRMGSMGTAGGGALLPVAQATAAQTALTRLGTQIDGVIRQMQALGQQHPQIQATSNFAAVRTDATRLQAEVAAISARPYTLQTRLDTASVRADLAAVQRDLANLRAAVPPITPQLNTAPIQAAIARTGTQIDGLLRTLQRLGQTTPQIRATANFTTLTQQITAIQGRLAQLGSQPITVQTRADLGQLQAQLAGAQRAFAALRGSIPPAEQAVRSFGQTSQQAAQHTHTLLDRITAIGQGLLIYRGFTLIETTISHLVQSIVQLPAAFEQAQIGFTAMLDNDSAAAAQMLTQIQQLANVTPFRFAQEQQAARTLLGLGVAAQNVLPELVDIDTAVAAVGGNEEQVQRVAAALGKMSAEGRVSAIFMNELTRDGIPAWRMLSEELGVSVAKVRELSENGEIAASTFERAFHDYTVRHWGNALSAQSQTFAGLVSTAQDLFEQFTRVFGMPLIQELEPKLRGALQALQDPRVLQTITQWGQGAATFAGWLFEAVGAVAQFLGLPTADLNTDLQNASDRVKEFAGDWSTVGGDGGPVANTKAQIAGINREIRQAEIDLRNTTRAAEETELTYKHQSDAISEQIRLLDAKYERENKATTLAELRAKIDKDARLADPYSAQGQAAGKRLVDERAQLARLLREQQHDTDKDALETQKRGVDDRAQTFREETARAQRAAQDRIDQLRQQVLDLQNAAAADTGAGGGNPPAPVVDTSGVKAASDEYRQFYDSTFRQGQSWGQSLKAVIDGLIAKIQQLGGAPGSALRALLDDWGLVTRAWDDAGPHASTVLGAVDRLATAMGARDGLQGVFIALRFEFERLMASLAAVTPPVLLAVGNGFSELGDAVTETVDTFSAFIAVQKFLQDRSPANEEAAANAIAQIAADRDAAQKRHAAFERESGNTGTTYQDRIAAINRDIDRRQAEAFRQADAQRGVTTRDVYDPVRTPNPYGPNGGYYNPSNFSNLPTPTAIQTQQQILLTGQIQVRFTGAGIPEVVDQKINAVITGKRLAQVLGEYASR